MSRNFFTKVISFVFVMSVFLFFVAVSYLSVFLGIQAVCYMLGLTLTVPVGILSTTGILGILTLLAFVLFRK